MTYTTDTPILRQGTVSAEALQAWLVAQGKRYAPGYGPSGKYAPIPGGLAAAIIDECNRYAVRQVGWDMVAAQIVHETAGWQSVYARERNNPGGIGAINSDPDQAIRFPSVAAGVRAHVAHLLVYAVGDGPWRSDDPRYDAVKRAGWLGVARRWRDLNGRWAWPGWTYAQTIATLANGLVSFANDGLWGQQMASDDGRFAWVPDTTEFGYPQGRRGRNGKPIDYLIVHITEGTDSLKWLTGNHGSSAHYLTNRDATPRAQMVAEADAAWTAGNREYNERGINIEFERFARDVWTDAEYRNAAETVWPIMKWHNIPIQFPGRDSAGKRGILGHEHVPDGAGGWGGTTHHTDPGPKFDWTRFVAELEAVRDAGAGDRPPGIGDPDARYVPETGAWLQWGFKAFWDSLDGAVRLKLLGWPVENERGTGAGVSVQRFERGYLVYDASQPDGWQIVALPLSRYAEIGVAP